MSTERLPEHVLRDVLMVATVGSTAHGISISTTGPAGDDLDLMGVYAPPREETFGLFEAKSRVWRTKPEGVPSEPGDIDFTAHTVRKFLSLAYKGNPTILAVLYSPEQHLSTDAGEAIRAQRDLFLSINAGYAFRGYAEQQHQRLMGERGQMKVKRPELITAHGYDTKYAAHILRLCHQGVVMLRDGFVPMPVLPVAQAEILAVRRGDVTFDDCCLMIAESRADLDLAIENTKLPRLPDTEAVNSLILDVYAYSWGVSPFGVDAAPPTRHHHDEDTP